MYFWAIPQQIYRSRAQLADWLNPRHGTKNIFKGPFARQNNTGSRVLCQPTRTSESLGWFRHESCTYEAKKEEAWRSPTKKTEPSKSSSKNDKFQRTSGTLSWQMSDLVQNDYSNHYPKPLDQKPLNITLKKKHQKSIQHFKTPQKHQLPVTLHPLPQLNPPKRGFVDPRSATMGPDKKVFLGESLGESCLRGCFGEGFGGGPKISCT